MSLEDLVAVALVPLIPLALIGVFVAVGRAIAFAEQTGRRRWRDRLRLALSTSILSSRDDAVWEVSEHGDLLIFHGPCHTLEFRRVPLRSRAMVVFGWLPGEGSYRIQIRVVDDNGAVPLGVARSSTHAARLVQGLLDPD